jgi:hypothetical protein
MNEHMPTYTVPATTKAEREQMARAARERNGQDSDSLVFQVSAEDEIPHLLEEIGRLNRANAQLRVACMKLLKERREG